MDCPSCGHGNSERARFCEACGQALAAPQCSACGADLSPSARFCPSCGAPTAASSSGSVPPPPAPTPRTTSLPTSFAGGRYVVKGFLGEGGRKRVYSARDQRLDRDVAFALVKTEGLDVDGRARVLREAQAMGRLGDHPNIVTVYDVGEEGGQPYIVSQYMGGGSVEDLLRSAPDHRLPVDEAMRIASQLCHALAHAHARDVVHRDLKPANVWLAPDGTAQLGDFGLAVALDRTRLSLEGTMVGTVAYMPPEQATGRGIDARSDLYSLGAMLYEMVAGRPPFVGDEPVSVISQHLNTPPVSPSWHNPEVNPGLEALILQLLAKAPDERPRSAAAVLDRLSLIEATPPTPSPAEPPPTPTTGLSSLTWGRFVARDLELSTLKRAVENALGGHGSLVMIAGEPGIGKTRLAEEVGVYARLRGAQVLLGRCYEDDGAPSFWPWMQILRAYAHERDPRRLMSEMGPGAADIAQLVSEIRVQLPELPAPPSVEPDQARFRLFDSITTFLKAAATSQPLLVILDDLQWADTASLLLLKFLTRQLLGSRLAIVGTYRDVHGGRRSALADTLAELGRERPYERIFLSGLSAPDVADLVEALAQHSLDSDGQQLARLLHRETAGNPLFIEEILRHLVETGRIYRKDGRWIVGDMSNIGELGVAEGARELIGSRLAQLSPGCNSLLITASVVGQEFDLDVLEAVVDLDEDALLDALDEAVGAGLLTEVRRVGGRHGYRFSHNLVREALYDSLSTARRVRVHRRVGEAMEAMHGLNVEPYLAQLAYHFLEGSAASDPAKAIDYATRAGQRATSLLAYEEAAGQFEAALGALDRVASADPRQRCDLLIALGDAQWRAGERAASQQTLHQAAAVARGLGDAERLGEVALAFGAGLGGSGFAARANAEAIELFEEALDLLGEGDSPLRARLLGRLATELYYTDASDRRDALSQAALEMAERLDDPDVRLVTLYFRLAAVMGPDASLEEWLSHAQEIVALATRVGNKEMAHQGHVFSRTAYMELCDIESARAEDVHAARLAEELRMPLYRWRTVVHRACWAMHDGRFDEAQKLAEEALTIGQDAEVEVSFAAYGGQAVQYVFCQGRSADLIEPLRNYAAEFPWLPAYRCALALHLTELGRLDEARDELRTVAADHFRNFPRDGNFLASLFAAAFVAERVAAPAIAADVYEVLSPFAERNVQVGNGIFDMGSCHGALGAAAMAMGRYDDAERHLTTAIEANRRMGVHGWADLAARQYVWLLMARNGDGDREKALALANELLELGRQIGMPPLVDAALAAKFELQGLKKIDVGSSLYAVASAVHVEQPDLRTHAAPDGTVTIMFSDIEGSTAMAERLGDERWLDLLHVHNDLVRTAVAEQQGYEVKAVGDGFMVAFASARRALRCAVAVQQALDKHNADHPDQPISVRIGIHTGEVIAEADDFFGRNVILASRVAAKANGGEVLVSSLVRDLVAGASEFAFDEGRSVDLKGLADAQTVHALRWR